MDTHWGDFVAEQTPLFSELVVGIDPILEDIPLIFHNRTRTHIECLDSYVDFILNAVIGHVAFVKFQSAFFEAFGSDGVHSLAKGFDRARRGGLGIILDAKRGDIGSTAAAYARAYLTPSGSDLQVDCMTVNPFLGPETLEPFVECARRYGKGLFVLVKTSNPGAGWIQDQKIGNMPVSDCIAQTVNAWADTTCGVSGLSAIGAVVGATFPEDGKRLRALMPNSVFLAPGLGPQGGQAGNIRSLRRDPQGGVLVPMSRGITKVDDLTLGADDYGQTIRDRIANAKASLL